MATVPTPTPRGEIPPGTLDMLVLRTVSLEPLHGYAIAQHIARLSQEVFRVEQGSLYPALERLQGKGWLKSKWGTTPTGRRARYYTITAAGQAQLQEKTAEYGRLAAAIARVMARA